ncbi:MAG TPA: hypothetical protein VER96_35850, partial [Polyangiaceae bacterium]|nr:hypothetical protein [Polyangiaceae bacterium]
MENRRLGQSDRGGGTKKRHRARSLIGLTLAGCVALGVSSCSATIESDEQTATAEQKILGPDARVVYGAKGAVDFVYTIGDLTVSCTGSIIAPHVVLTAARCLLPQNPYDAHDGERDITINYYDPVYGRRVVHTGNAQWHAHPSFPDYSLDPGILNEANTAKNDPKHGRKRGRHSPPYWHRHPRFPGDVVDPLILDEADTSKNDIAVIIVPEQLGSLNTGTTDYHDYLRIFAGNAHDHLDGHLNAFGAGLYEADRSDDQLRYGNFDTDVQNNGSPGPDFLKLEGRQGGDALRMCRGDNGGAIEYSLNIEGQSVPTVAAVWSNYNVGSDWAQDESQDCANDNHGHDDSYACILNNDHVAWIESAAGLSCAPQSGANIAYKRCFDLPMIEDAPGEGLYAPNVATA